MRGLLRILPADHAVGEYRRAQPGELRAANLLLGAHPAQRLEMAVRTKDARPRLLLLERTIKISRAEKARHRLQRHVLDRIAFVFAAAVDDNVQGFSLRQRPKPGARQKFLAQFLAARSPGLERRVAGARVFQLAQNLLTNDVRAAGGQQVGRGLPENQTERNNRSEEHTSELQSRLHVV